MRVKRVDNNHKQICTALKRVGAVVTDIHIVPNAFDVLVSFRGKNFVLEIKDPSEFPKYFYDLPDHKKQTYLESKLTKGELKCKTRIESTGNVYHIAYDIKSALEIIGANKPLFS